MVPATVLQRKPVERNQKRITTRSVFTSFKATEFFITLLTNCTCLSSYQHHSFRDSSAVISSTDND
jgi:hypothetical protein